MVQAKSNGNLMWPRGDTYTIRVDSTSLEMTDTDYLMFAICDANTYKDVYSQIMKMVSMKLRRINIWISIGGKI